MVITAHQPNYLPWAGLFHKIALAEMHVIYDDVAYSKYGYSNRNYIRGHNGAVLLSVPVLGASRSAKRIDELQIDSSNGRWRRKHWEAIRNCYSKTPFFRLYEERIADIYEREWDRLVELNVHILSFLLDALGLKRPVVCASTLGLEGQKGDRVIELCRKVGATSFIFGASGRKYVDLDSFASSGIEPLFQSFQHPEYASDFRGETPPVSVIDLLFHCGPDSLAILLRGQATLSDLRRGLATAK